MDKDLTYIKLFRKLVRHPIFQDPNALRVFIWILCNVDYKTGEMQFGRSWAAVVLKINPNTLKSVIERISKRHQLVTTSVTNKHTTIRVSNWAKYQGDHFSSPTPSPNRHQQNTTNQEYIYTELFHNSDKSDGLKTLEEEVLELDKGDKIRSEYQWKGLEMWDKLAAPPNKKASFIKVAKEENPGLVEEAYRFALGYPITPVKWKVFFKRLSNLKGGKKDEVRTFGNE